MTEQHKPEGPLATAIALMVGGAASNQVGAAFGARAFPALGPAGVVAVRQIVAAIVLCAAARPKFWRYSAHQIKPILFLALVFATMNLSLYMAIEHIGLGSYDQDPLDADGDTVTMARAYTWVKPGGWCYLDVPYRPQGPYSVNSNFRAYDPEALQTRLIQSAPWRVRWQQTMGQPRGDGPYVALVLEKPA